jgi:hypothetical protein
MVTATNSILLIIFIILAKCLGNSVVHHFDAFMGEMSTANTIIVGGNQNFK